VTVRAGPTTPPASIRVSPNAVAAGGSVTLSGSVGPDSAGSECATGVRLLSRAFARTKDSGELPAVYAAAKPDGTFTTTTVIPRSRAAGTYPITGRCGGGNFGGATLEVRAAPTTPTTTPEPMAPPVTQPPGTLPPGVLTTTAHPPARRYAGPGGLPAGLAHPAGSPRVLLPSGRPHRATATATTIPNALQDENQAHPASSHQDPPGISQGAVAETRGSAAARSFRLHRRSEA
jgi:hypothetical protein